MYMYTIIIVHSKISTYKYSAMYYTVLYLSLYMCIIVLHCTGLSIALLLQCNKLYCTVLYLTILCIIVLYCTGLSIVLVLQCNVLYCTWACTWLYVYHCTILTGLSIALLLLIGFYCPLHEQCTVFTRTGKKVQTFVCLLCIRS